MKGMRVSRKEWSYQDFEESRTAGWHTDIQGSASPSLSQVGLPSSQEGVMDKHTLTPKTRVSALRAGTSQHLGRRQMAIVGWARLSTQGETHLRDAMNK